MSDVLEILWIILVYSITLGLVPILLLYVARKWAAERKRLDELQARVDLLEARDGNSDRVTRDTAIVE
jgi:hypothetical protein